MGEVLPRSTLDLGSTPGWFEGRKRARLVSDGRQDRHHAVTLSVIAHGPDNSMILLVASVCQS